LLVLLATLAIGELIGLLVLASSLFRKTFKTSSQHKTNVAEIQKPTLTLSSPDIPQSSSSLKAVGAKE
jgi:lipopolysaccharide assembly protein A